MADLILSGTLDLSGSLKLNGSAGGKVKVDGNELLVKGASGKGSPVLQPPQNPTDKGARVEVTASKQASVTIAGAPIVAGGVTMQGDIPTWPGTVSPSTNNTGVTIGGTLANVVGDTAITVANGGSTTLTDSGQAAAPPGTSPS